MPVQQRRLVDVELVGIDRALHDRLAEPVRRGDEDGIAEAGFSIEGEHDAAEEPTSLRTIDCTPTDRATWLVVEPLVHAIRDGAIVVQ